MAVQVASDVSLRAHRPNETEVALLSASCRAVGLRRRIISQPSTVLVQRPAVGWSDWLDVMASIQRSLKENPEKSKSEHKVRPGAGEVRASGNARSVKLR